MTSQTPSQRLRTKLDLVYPVLSYQAERLWSGPFAAERYRSYLVTMHMIVRSAVPLMQNALNRARQLGETDNVAAGLVTYLERHLEEERNHDEWLLEDLEVTGVHRQEALSRIPSPTVASLVGAQYYWIHHHHPVYLLGHIAAIEGYPPPSGFGNLLCEITGLPRAAFRAIAIHERLDLRHRLELYDAIDRLPLDDQHEVMIGVSALHTLQASVDVLAELDKSPGVIVSTNGTRNPDEPAL